MSEGKVPRLTLGRKMRLAREDAHIGSSEMAESLDVVRHTITGYEYDRHTPQRSTLKEWARITGCSLEWLLDDDAGIPPVSQINGGPPTPNITQAALAALIAKLLMGNGGDESGQPHRWSTAELDLMPVIDLTGDESATVSYLPQAM